MKAVAGVTLRAAVGVALSVALCAALWVVDYLPTNDGPNHILHGYLEIHLDAPSRGYSQFLEPAFAVTSLGFPVPFALLLRWLDWHDALRVTLSLGALLWAWGYVCLTAALNRQRILLGAFGFATALSWALYMGFFSFWIAGGLALFVVAYGLWRPAWLWRERAVLGCGTLIVAVAHVFVAELLGAVLLALVFARPSGKGRWRDVGALALVGLPSLALALWAAQGSTEAYRIDYPSTDPFGTTWLGVADSLAMPWHCFTAGPWWRGALPPLLALAGITLAAVRAHRRGAARKSCPLAADERSLAIVAALFCVLGMVAPFHIEVWKYLAPRFAPLGVMLGIALLPVERVRSPRLRSALAVAAAGFALVAVGWSVTHHRHLAAAEADGLAGMRQPLERSGPRLPLRLTLPATGVAHALPGVNLGHLYVIEQGGMTPYLFATRSGIHPHVYRGARRRLFPPFPGRFYFDLFRRAGQSPEAPPKPVQLAWLALLGSQYQDVILQAEPDDAEKIIARGYAVDFRQGRAAVLRYQGCGLDVSIVATSPLLEPLLVEYGWAPVLETAGGVVAAAGTRFETDEPRVAFAEAPCGSVWVRVTWDRDRSGTVSAGDGFCRGADRAGRLLAKSTGDDHVVRCEPATTIRE